MSSSVLAQFKQYEELKECFGDIFSKFEPYVNELKRQRKDYKVSEILINECEAKFKILDYIVKAEFNICKGDRILDGVILFSLQTKENKYKHINKLYFNKFGTLRIEQTDIEQPYSMNEYNYFAFILQNVSLSLIDVLDSKVKQI